MRYSSLYRSRTAPALLFLAVASVVGFPCHTWGDGTGIDLSLQNSISPHPKSSAANHKPLPSEVAPEAPRFEIRSEFEGIGEVRLRGRVQWQFAHVRGTSPRSRWSGQEFRRVRLGAQGVVRNDFSWLIDFNTLPDDLSVSDAWVTWRRHEVFQPTVGYMRPRFGHDATISSLVMLTMERSLISNTLGPGRLPGIQVSGVAAPFEYSLGWFQDQDAFQVSSMLDGPVINPSLSVDLSRLIGSDQPLLLRADYLYSDNTQGATSFEHSFSVSNQLTVGPVDFSTEFLYGYHSATGGNVTGILFTPSMYLIPGKLQGVLRYEYTVSSDPDGLRMSNRYQRRLPDLPGERGNRYHSLYGGLNYYIYGDQLKVMLGVEYENFADTMTKDPFTVNSVTFWGAVRMFF